MVEKVGYVPDSVIYVCRKPTVFTTHWNGNDWTSRLGDLRTDANIDISEADEGEALIHQKNVISTFPVSGDSKNLESRLKTARDWAAGGYYSAGKQGVDKEVTKDNKPFTVQICGLDVRSQGGRAYKVIDNEGHMFDLREDVFFESLMKFGCGKDGHIPCEFLWCMSGSSLKLVRDGSEFHKALLRATDRRNTTPIAIPDLVPGCVYRTKNLTAKLFVGWIPAPRTKSKYKLVWLDDWGIKYHSEQGDLATYIQSKLPIPPKGTYRQWIGYGVTADHSMVEKLDGDYSKFLGELTVHITDHMRDEIKEEKRRLSDLKKSPPKNHWAYGNNEEYLKKEIARHESRINSHERQLKTLEKLIGEMDTIETSALSPT